MAKPITVEYCSEFCKSLNFTFLSTSIKKAKDYVDIMCPKKHIFNINWDAFRYKKKCPVCTKIQDKNRRKTPVKKLVDYINNAGYKIIRFINGYQDNRSKFLVKCSNNHVYPTDWQHFKDRGQKGR